MLLSYLVLLFEKEPFILYLLYSYYVYNYIQFYAIYIYPLSDMRN
jgi:hypothetical protein